MNPEPGAHLVRRPFGVHLLRPAPGVRVDGTAWRCDVLGITVSTDVAGSERTLLELGLAERAGLVPVLSRVLPASTVGALAVTAATTACSCVGWVVLLGLAAVAGTLTGSAMLIGGALLGALTLASLSVHECGHAVALRALPGPPTPARIVTRGAGARILRHSRGSREDLVVVVAGPLAPLLVAVPVALVLGPLSLVGAASLALGAAHAVCLLLPLGDGREVRELLRSRAPAPGREG